MNNTILIEIRDLLKEMNSKLDDIDSNTSGTESNTGDLSKLSYIEDNVEKLTKHITKAE